MTRSISEVLSKIYHAELARGQEASSSEQLAVLSDSNFGTISYRGSEAGGGSQVAIGYQISEQDGPGPFSAGSKDRSRPLRYHIDPNLELF